MNKFYILCESYSPNTAYTNHVMSFIRGFDELGIAAHCYFLYPNASSDKVSDNYNNVEIHYLWNKFSKIRILKRIIKQLNMVVFYLTLKKGDAVLLLGMPSFVCQLTKRKGVKVYHERTEHPEAVQVSTYSYFKNHYYDGCRRLDGLFVISKALKDYFVSIGVDETKIHVVNMVVDINRFRGIQKQCYNEKYIAYCGTASNSKDGVDLLIKAFSLAKKRIPDLKLYIIGPVPKKSDNSVLVEHLGLSDSIVFTGVVSRKEMPQLLMDASALALIRPDTLQNKYGFPTKLGEYLLTGNPVVVTKVGDIPLFLMDNVSALMIDCGDVESAADKFCYVFDHPEEARVIGEQGKQIAETCFNYMIETRKMVDVIFTENNPS